jgi:isopenicillin N synthase-like dioxygenase
MGRLLTRYVVKENFDHGAPNDTQFPNKWPSDQELPGFRPKLEKFYNDCASISNILLGVLAIALDMPPSSFTSRVALNQSSTMRFNHNPEVPLALFDKGETCRIWPHFDFGIITLVFRESLGGLEIENRKRPGSFVPIPCQSREEMLVNIGETFERWTNKVLPAGLHRVTKPHREQEVVNGLVPERYSVAFFCKADRDVSVGPFDNFLVGKERHFDDITAIQYQELRNRATYDK